MSGHREKTTICKPGRKVSGEINTTYILILDFLQGCEIINFCL